MNYLLVLFSIFILHISQVKSMPKNEIIIPSCYYLHVTENIVEFCKDQNGKGNDCAAALLVYLINFHNGKQELKQYNEMTNAALRAQGKEPVADVSDWQFHTDAYLRKRLFFWKTDTILKAITFLKDEKKILRTDAPAQLRKLYKTGRTKWFLIDAHKLNQWTIENYYKAQYFSTEYAPDGALQPLERKPANATIEREQTAQKVFKLWQLVFGKMSVSPDDRIKMISARLRQKKTFADCCQAIFGNSKSEFHQGKWNQIRNIFPNNEKLEFFQDIAENYGINAAKAVEMAEKIVSDGKPLMTRADAAQTAKASAKTINRSALMKTAKLVIREVVELKTKLRQFIEIFFNLQEELQIVITDINEPTELAKTIIDLLSEKEIVSDARKVKIDTFCVNFIKALEGEEIA